jgi:N-acyl homoserine lactone hydrolase
VLYTLPIWVPMELLMVNRTLLCLLSCFLLAACEKPLRLPYVPAELQNWPARYTGVRRLQLDVFQTGTVELPARLVYRGGSLLDTYTLDILVFVIEHPRHGLILIGTGLNRKIATEPEQYLGSFRTALGNPKMKEGQDIIAQLEQANLPLKKIHHVILPDLRLDHAGELESFPAAKAVVTAAEHSEAMTAGGQLYVSKEYDTVREWQFISFAGAGPLGTFKAHKDLFGDGSVVLIDATGVTAGGLAVLVRLPDAPVLLCGNLAWTEEQYRYARWPGLLFERAAWWDTVWRLKKFKELVPDAIILPDHDWAAVEEATTDDIVLYPFATDESAEDDDGTGT